MNIEETIRRRWEKFEPMRIRMMQEAYDCADRNEVEAYNSIKVMCGEVLRMAEELVLAEREAFVKACEDMEEKAEGTECCKWPTPVDCAYAIRARGNHD
jgi:hypothetical protein